MGELLGIMGAVGLGFPGGSVGKESACNVGRPGFDPWVGKIPGERNSYPLQYLAWRIISCRYCFHQENGYNSKEMTAQTRDHGLFVLFTPGPLATHFLSPGSVASSVK